MTTDYDQLDEQLPLAEAANQLADTARWGVVSNAAGTQLALVSAASLTRALHTGEGQQPVGEARGHLPPLLLINSDAPLYQVAALPQIVLLTKGAEGIIVLDGQQVVGVLSAEEMQRYLEAEYNLFGAPLGGSGSLPGGISTPTLKVVCATCQMENELDEIDLDNLPPCVNIYWPAGVHTLKVGWM